MDVDMCKKIWSIFVSVLECLDPDKFKEMIAGDEFVDSK